MEATKIKKQDENYVLVQDGIDKLLKSELYKEKTKGWALFQLSKALSNVDYDELTKELIDEILKGEFGLGHKKEDTLKEVQKATNALYKEKGNSFEYFYDRWQDEKHYEDFNDYKKAIKDLIPKEFTFKKVTEKPFRITLELKGFKITFTINSKATRTTIKEL